MNAIQVSPPALEPISLAEAKLWLRVDDPAEDAPIASLIVAARATVERQARRLLITQGWRVILDAFPTDGVIRLPLAPVTAVMQIRVLDAAGLATVVPGDRWRSEATREPPLIVLTAPPPLPGRSSTGIEIDLTCGYGAAATDVPEPLRHAMRLLVARWYERRGDDDAQAQALPPDVALLLAPFHAPRLT